MVSRWKKVTVGIIAVFTMVCAAAFAATTLYPLATVSFSGIEMVKNNGATQGFVDITLKNVNATGISFCLEYDTDYLELSNVKNNAPIASTYGQLNIEHEYFEQNTDNFPDGIFQDNKDDAAWLPNNIVVNLPIIGISDQDASTKKGHIRMNFIPQKDTDLDCEYISKDKYGVPYINAANVNGGLNIGRISFRIKNPDEFAKLSSADLKQTIKIVAFSSMDTVKKDPDATPDPSVTPDPGTTAAPNAGNNDTGVGIAYLDSDNRVKYHINPDRNIKAEFDIKVKLADVQPQIKEITVSAYDIYRNGTEQDLFDFLNSKMSVLTLEYADNTQEIAVFNWQKADCDIIGPIATWDPRGDSEFSISQDYNDDFEITVKVTITPVNLIGFDVDRENMTYLYGSSDFPKNFDDLQLPQKARPILDTYIPNGGVAKVLIGWWSEGDNPTSVSWLPPDFDDGDPHNYVYKGHINENISEKYPWLTLGVMPEIQCLRNVVTKADDMPKELEVESAVTDADGVLTIIVKNKDGSDIQDGTVFDIKMSNGERIDTGSMGSRYTVNIDNGKAKIVLDPDITVDSEKMLAQLINLGNRADGDFSIASTEPDKNKGPFTDFETNPRRNIYLEAIDENGQTSNYYEFDYSTLTSAMFPIRAGTGLAKTIRLPRPSDFIRTTYSGYDGTVEGMLNTFTVKDWIVADGNPNTVGSIVTAEGKLADTSYANYGEVFNDKDIYVRIKYVVLENDGAIDEIDIIPNTEYDPRQEGYDYDDLQTKSFTIRNTGTTDLYGLKAEISLSAVSNKEAFEITKNIPITMILSAGQSTDLDITTKIGLPVLGDGDFTEYKCTVSISNNNDVLQSFDISFTVTKAPVYKINIIIPDDQQDFGTAETANGLYAAIEGTAINIIATPEEDCEFVDWEVISGTITLSDPLTSPTNSFNMPGEDITIEAHFQEGLGAKLRATELIVKDKDDVDQKLYDSEWKEIQFDPVKREYYSVVPNDTDKVKLWFKLRDEAETMGATLDLTLTHDPGCGSDPHNLSTPAKDTTDEYYKTQEIDLDISPVENIVELKLTSGTVPRSYTIHIYRKLKNSELMTFDYGNSPYGLIMRDPNLTSAQQQDYKDEFRDNNYVFVTGKTPKDGVTGIRYTPEAWGSGNYNYDLDETVLFVINTDSFVDPGYTDIKNSLGKDVDETTVSKKVEKVNVLAEIDDTLKNGSSNDFVWLEDDHEFDLDKLKEKRIRPGICKLTYSFTDFDNKTVSVSKPLIILNPLGDVNISGEADDEDVYRILHRFSTDIASNHNIKKAEPTASYEDDGLFKYRVCDANNDGNLNAIDANRIRKGGLPSFYKNLSEGGGSQ